jgi:hypothetical protein
MRGPPAGSHLPRRTGERSLGACLPAVAHGGRHYPLGLHDAPWLAAGCARLHRPFGRSLPKRHRCKLKRTPKKARPQSVCLLGKRTWESSVQPIARIGCFCNRALVVKDHFSVVHPRGSCFCPRSAHDRLMIGLEGRASQAARRASVEHSPDCDFTRPGVPVEGLRFAKRKGEWL